MLNVKLIVLFICVTYILVSCSKNYCEICRRHTQCIYRVPGPSSTCEKYDESSLLTKEDVANIVNKINERRNFVASGLSSRLPHAANMKKVVWSKELAVSAQRWVDQCDSDTHPDKEDECRNLENMDVGQNIVSVSGPAPGMIVHSLIDVWFTKGLDYRGSVSYYNYTQDWKTNYFTQLIWGDTDRVGCGKAKFYIDNKKTMVERLVCNFAPKGNIHGKPVYAIGYPATQCQENMVPDRKFPSLCAVWVRNNVTKSTQHMPPVTSLLRILNLSNNSVKQDIDPIKNNLRQIKIDNNETIEQRNQKTRHVFSNNRHVVIKNIPQLYKNFNTKNYANDANSLSNGRIYQERGHSRVYHGHDPHEINVKTDNTQLANQDFRKYGFSIEPLKSTASNYRKHECTRKNKLLCDNPINLTYDVCKSTCEQIISQCTRGRATNDCVHATKTCPDNLITHEIPHEECSCNTPTTCPPTQPKCPCNVNCPCFEPVGATTICPLRRKNYLKETKRPSEFHYYDLFPNLAIRSGDTLTTDVSFAEKPRLNKDFTVSNKLKHYTYSTKKDYHEDISDTITHIDYSKPKLDYIYDSTDYRTRQRRNAKGVTFKPFWQIDEFIDDKADKLKSLMYTTLQNKKQRKTKYTTSSIHVPQTTEIITVKIKKDSSNHFPPLKNVITEKYLSFDELMHLRRFGASDTNVIMNARRDEGTQTSETSSTSKYTTNTPFERQKHCTRKLTCTWTAASITDANGSIIDPGNHGDRGSRTPPGYVEGCTRTSTCTRDHMDRNKFSTLKDDSETESVATSIEDEDYCEKRALNVKRRDSYLDNQPLDDPQSYTNLAFESNFFSTVSIVTYTPFDESTTIISQHDCDCPEDHPRVKRNKIYSLSSSSILENLSYGDVYYLVLQKIMGGWKTNQNLHRLSTCMCNSSALLKTSFLVAIFILLLNFIGNKFI